MGIKILLCMQRAFDLVIFSISAFITFNLDKMFLLLNIWYIFIEIHLQSDSILIIEE